MVLGELMGDEAGKVVIQQNLGEGLAFPESQKNLDLIIDQIAVLSSDLLTSERIKTMENDLGGLDCPLSCL